MCGIAGMMVRGGGRPPEGLAGRLQKALRHRGPDGAGHHAKGNTLLVQTRLAIIDLDGGGQPLYLKSDPGGDTDLALVANGEIYNYIELRQELGRGRFRTSSDCEPPLHLYRRIGLDFVNRLRGMYAIAIHDGGKDRLVLARDPFGIKPLYYAETANGFCFASEPQALTQAGLVRASLNIDSLDEVLELQFSTGRETAFKEIYRVLPGELLVIEAGHVVERRGLDYRVVSGPRAVSESRALSDLDETFENTMRLHQRSDVGYGMFFSGGIDSSALLAMMRRLDPGPVTAITMGFDGAARDETDHARKVARDVGLRHRVARFGEEDFWSLLSVAAGVVDDPTADYAILPTLKLARVARETGLKVVLSGEGGDELFAGYGRYRRAIRHRWLGGRAMRDRGVLDALGLSRRSGKEAGWRRGVGAEEARWDREELSNLQKAQYVDCADWLPNDLLTKLDRCLMTHGIEGRVPFLDEAMAAFAFTLPDRLKTKRRMGKWLLRRWLSGVLPVSDPFSKKRGFTVPVESWIFGRGPLLVEALSRQPLVRDMCRLDRLRTLAGLKNKDVGRGLWILLFVALWHARHIEGKKIEGDPLVALADGP